MRPLILRSRVATIRPRSIRPRPEEIRVPAIGEIPAYRSTHPSCANSAFPLRARADGEIHASSVAPLTICWGSNIPAFLQRLADLRLRKLFSLRKIVARIAWLPVFCDKLRRLHVIRFPIQIEDLLLRSQKIFRMSMALQTPSHAVRLGHIDHRHVIDRTVATEATDAAVHMRGVIVIDIIDGSVNPHPVDRVAGLPAFTHGLKLGIVLLHLGVAVHAKLRVWHIGLRRDFDKAVTISAVHPQLRHVDIVRKWHRLDRLISHLRVFRRHVIPCRARQSADEHNAAKHKLDRHPVRPTWKKIRHD